MIAAFPMVPLREVAVPVERLEAPLPGTRYRQIGVKLWGQGAYERESIDGSETQYKTLSRVETDDIVVNKIWARNGSVAVVPPHLAGCYGSGEFPTFAPMRDKLEPRWAHWLTTTRYFWDQCDLKSRGTSGKNRIRPEQFLAVEIPLPPLAEQRRIVARIEAVAAKIEEARGLQRQVLDQLDALCRSMIMYDARTTGQLTAMRDLVRLRQPDVVVRPNGEYQFAGVYSFGRGVFRGERKSGMQTAYARLTRLRVGEFVYPKLMAWEGALGVVPAECDGLVVSPEFPVFEIDQSQVLPDVLDVYFRTPLVWPLLSGASTGTNVRRRRLHPSEFLAFKIPLPAMDVQYRLREVKAKADALKRLQAETAAALDALLPAVLDRAFKGEL
jgi:type I restriction enzyme S subunit